tara:strand:- start:336 stop:857 length:522 start_codon:yes stop_codon:yes gene_type:complete
MKTKKRKKSIGMRGKGMGTHGGGARKKRKKSGHKGGIGMSGSGKRADHKKTLITKLYGNKYFGKQGITSRGTKKDKRDRINLLQIERDVETYLKKGLAKKSKEGIEINLTKHKILSGPNNHVPKNKLIITAKEASKSSIDKIEKSGGKIFLRGKTSGKKQSHPIKKRNGENVK